MKFKFDTTMETFVAAVKVILMAVMEEIIDYITKEDSDYGDTLPMEEISEVMEEFFNGAELAFEYITSRISRTLETKGKEVLFKHTVVTTGLVSSKVVTESSFNLESIKEYFLKVLKEAGVDEDDLKEAADDILPPKMHKKLYWLGKYTEFKKLLDIKEEIE